MGELGAESCTISVNVIGESIDGVGVVHSNVAGPLTSDAGESGTATAELTVDLSLPGFSKSFSPSSVPLGGRSTLTFKIDNSANDSVVTFLDFTDILPEGMVIDTGGSHE